MRQLRFRALITLYPVALATGTPLSSPAQYPGHTVALVILARPLRDGGGRARYLPTEIWQDGGTPLHPGGPALVTIKVTDDQAGDFLDVGQAFTLWCGGQVGHGTVVRRLT